jgi:hypothetical protein
MISGARTGLPFGILMPLVCAVALKRGEARAKCHLPHGRR